MLTDRFEEQRPRLRSLAVRMLGSTAEADDAVQEAWLRADRADTSQVESLDAWLTTVVARVCLDMLRARRVRAVPIEDVDRVAPTPEDEALLADAVGGALIAVLDTLTPPERLAFVLHDAFSVSFDEIGRILGRSPNAAKQLAYRARAKVQGAEGPVEVDPVRQRAVVDAFLAAARGGDFEGLLALLHPDVVLDADAMAVRMGSPAAVDGADAVAAVFCGRALGAQPAVIDGAVGIAWAIDGTTKVAWEFSVRDGKVAHIEMLAAPETLHDLDLALLEG